MWSEFAYDVGGLLFSLDEIEHGVLRCNRGHPKDKKPMFVLENDPRMKLMLTKFDARIHFALNCGANSCPPIRIYQADRLNAQVGNRGGSGTYPKPGYQVPAVYRRGLKAS